VATKIDIKNAARLRRDKNGFRAERIAIVSGVAGVKEDLLYNALNDAGLPSIGSAHPNVPSIQLQESSVEPMGGGQYRVILSYYRDTGVVTGSAQAESKTRTGLAIEETNLDINGQPLKTQYSAGLVGGPVRVFQRFTAEVERPRMVHEFEYTASQYPTADINNYLGKVNSAVWNGYAIGAVLCNAINVDQSGAEFRVTYQFAVKLEGWTFNAKTVYPPPLRPIQGTEIDNALDLEKGIRPFDVYRSVDFNPLGFTLKVLAFNLLADSAIIQIQGKDATLTVA